ncbi:MAG: N-6 DNA methylase, partial [Acidobacteria bacterium]|nr:N-6 DNA methylase [Acidobacteriota bacterium]
MANERKTETFVRDHFRPSTGLITLEEQKSDIPRIEKLLKTASKRGTGIGRPEFIITYNENSDFLTVVECKADVSKHESKTKDRFSEFAVDGVLLYSSYLSKEFDVLAIAVSGEQERQAKVSHFLQLKNERNAVPIFGEHLLSTNDYLQGYLKSPEKLRQDYNSLLDFSKKLNETLHGHKILESQRSLLISCILIALEHSPFKVAYKQYTDPAELSNYLVNTVVDSLKKAKVQTATLKNLDIQFGFIRTDTSLSTKLDVLKNLITDIDDNINGFMKNHRYYDVLGQLYVEFLRYANSDKGLGIVLTPPHITELFSDLAQVNKDSIVYDNCTGTGGYLISAMSKMVKDAKGDQAAIESIKTSQLVGVEYQSHIFALACSNMYIHQDGKTNILNGDCFDRGVMAAIQDRKPTTGFLNPPYKADRKKDIEELRFVLNNLECLAPRGTCIAIVPMQSALAQKGRIY